MTALAEEPASLSWPVEGVALITLTKGETHNTLTTQLLACLDELIDRATAAKARVVVLTGSGKTFCGGAHIKLFTDPASAFYRNPRALRDEYVAPIIRVFSRLRDSSFVSVAAINGFALGGGCELALACDFRLMADTARIGLSEVRLGALAAAGGVQSLAHVVGRAKALEIALLGDQWSAEDARAAGLVTAVHPADALPAAALEFARRLLLCSPVSVAETKRALYRCATAGAEEADRIALDAVLAASAGDEWWEGMAAFAERRQPSFRKGN